MSKVKKVNQAKVVKESKDSSVGTDDSYEFRNVGL